MLSVHQQEGRAPLVVSCVLLSLSLDEGFISLGRFCLLESPFLFSPHVHLSSFVVLPGFMPPVFPGPFDD